MEAHMDPTSLIARVGGQWAGYELQREFQQEVADLLGRSQRSFPGAQPVSFSARHLEILKQEDYFVCEKTDGLRYLMYLTRDGDRDIHYMIDRKNDYYYVPGLHFPHHEDKTFTRFHDATILDGELVEDRYPDRPPVIKYFVFDCLVLDGNILMKRTLDKRLAYFKSHVLEPYKAMFRQNPTYNRPFVVEDKTTQFSYSLSAMFHDILPRVKLLHGNDGLIFTCKNTPYHPGTDQHILKWKPPQDNTVDFLLHIEWRTQTPEPDDPDQSPLTDYHGFPQRFELYIFQGGTDYGHVADLHVEESEWEDWKAQNRPLQDSIVECFQEDLTHGSATATGNGIGNGNGVALTNGTGEAVTKRWRFYRFRDDKHEANHISTFNSVIESIEDHVTEDDLIANADEIRTAWKKRAAAVAEEAKRRATK